MKKITQIMIGIVVFLTVATSTAQEKKDIYANPQNLKVLPEGINPTALGNTMKGFALGLGMRCETCHVGEAGMSLSDFDFPADDKRTKGVAREMLRMVQMINRDVIANIEEPSGAQVTCFTCHNGQLTPPPQLHTHLIEIVSEDGIEAAMIRYDELRAEFYGTGVYNFGPRTFTRVADRLIEDDMADEAIAKDKAWMQPVAPEGTASLRKQRSSA